MALRGWERCGEIQSGGAAKTVETFHAARWREENTVDRGKVAAKWQAADAAGAESSARCRLFAQRGFHQAVVAIVLRRLKFEDRAHQIVEVHIFRLGHDDAVTKGRTVSDKNSPH